MPGPIRRATLAALVALAAVPAAAAAQTNEEAAVRAVVDRLFDAMRAGDSTAVRGVFHPEARMIATQPSEEGPVVRTIPFTAFVEAVGRPHEEVWDERIWDVEIRVDDDLAVAWMEYAFYLGGELSHCGVDAFMFSKAADGWAITQIADTRRQEGCEVPEAARPR